MKNRRFQLITMVALALIMVLCIPSSFAKYAKSEKFTVPVKVHYNFEKPKIYYDKVGNVQAYKYSDVANGYCRISIDKDGYYIIVLKGGNGGSGMNQSGGSINSLISGGTGGTMVCYLKLNIGDYIDAYLGSAGGPAGRGVTKIKSTYYPSFKISSPSREKDDNRMNFTGLSGTNAKGLGLGTEGNYVKFSEHSNTASNQMYVTSGGSGAASIVSLNGSDVLNSMIFAGGGGAGASYDSGASAWWPIPAKGGGNGGSNIDSNSVGVFDGTDGFGNKDANNIGASSDNCDTSGGGGTSSGGRAGNSTQVWYSIVYTLPAGTASVGNSYGNTNSGKGGAGKYNGGPGGGGYCGGGGGCGLSADLAAGGGGGGSSYLGSKFTWDTSKSKIYTDSLSKTSFASEKDGWIIVAKIFAKDKDGKAVEITSIDEMLMS